MNLLAQEDNSGILHCSLDLTQEGDSLTSINEPVVVGQSHVHHGSNHNLNKILNLESGVATCFE